MADEKPADYKDEIARLTLLAFQARDPAHRLQMLKMVERYQQWRRAKSANEN